MMIVSPGSSLDSLQRGPVQWRRSVTLGDIVRLLGDLQSVVGVPAQVQELEETKVSLAPCGKGFCCQQAVPSLKHTSVQHAKASYSAVPHDSHPGCACQ